VGHHGIAFVAARGEQDRGPEVLEGGEVVGPVANDGVEDWADIGVETDLGVEAVYQVLISCSVIFSSVFMARLLRSWFNVCCSRL
jgi:hypothetical protein